jgi:hypothetical protein
MFYGLDLFAKNNVALTIIDNNVSS